MRTTPVCCFIEEGTGVSCEALPEWEIHNSPYSPDDYTHSCSKHVGEMLTDAKEHRIYRYADIWGDPAKVA